MAIDLKVDEEIHRALCVRHPNCKQLHFCIDCIKEFCADCRSLQIEGVNHLSHRMTPLQEVLKQRRERMVVIQKLISATIFESTISL